MQSGPDGVPSTKAIYASQGITFVGYVFCLGLWGVTLSQSIFYFYHFPRDGRFRKAMVLCMNLVDVVHISLISSMFWDMLVYNRFYDPSARASYGHPWQLFAFFPTLSIMEMTTQGFFCHRVWRVSRGNMAIVCVIISCAILAAIALLVGLFHGPFPILSMHTIVRLNLTPLLIVDGTIYGSLIYYFNSSRLGMPRTEPVLRQLIWLSVNTGFLLWLFTAISFYMYEREPEDPGSILAPTFILSQLYMNSMMAALNSRRHFRALVNRTLTDTVPVSEASRIAIE